MALDWCRGMSRHGMRRFSPSARARYSDVSDHAENTQRRRTVPLTDDVSPPAEGSDHEALVSVVSAEVRAALRTLPEEQRQVIALAYLGGYTQCEVAKLTGVPLGTVKSRTFAAIRRLRATLGNLWAGETGETTGANR